MTLLSGLEHAISQGLILTVGCSILDFLTPHRFFGSRSILPPNMHAPSLPISNGRIPCLDGMRAISILGVAYAHAHATRGFPHIPGLSMLGDLGNLGVRVFFVISGFLITFLLLKESDKNGKISLRGFYERRIIRIFPAFYGYLLVIGILALAGVVAMDWSDFEFAAVYLINFVAKKSWAVGHLWSLSVEEQFYLLWPTLIVLAGWRRALGLAIGSVLLAPLLRVAWWYLFPTQQDLATKAFPTICDAIATGCVLACLRDKLSEWKLYNQFVSSWWFLLVPCAIMASNALASHTRPDYLIGQTIRNVGIALCLDWFMRYPESRVGRILNLRPIVWLGTLSYSFYLWQQLFLDRHSDALWCRFPFNLGFTFLAALASFYLIEQPFLRLRARRYLPRLAEIPTTPLPPVSTTEV